MLHVCSAQEGGKKPTTKLVNKRVLLDRGARTKSTRSQADKAILPEWPHWVWFHSYNLVLSTLEESSPVTCARERCATITPVSNQMLVT